MHVGRTARGPGGRPWPPPAASPPRAFGDDTLFLERLVAHPAAHRGAGPRGQPRQRHPPGRARVLAAAPPPEGHRGSAVAAAGLPTAPSPRPDRRGRLRGRPQRRLHRRRHRGVPGLRRRPGRVLLHGDEHPAAGRTPGHRDGHRRRPGRVAGADRRRRGAHRRARTTSCSPATRWRPASTPRIPERNSCPRRRNGAAGRARRERPIADAGVRGGHPVALLRAAWKSPPTTTRCWPRSSPGARTAPRPWTGWTRRSAAHRRWASTPTSNTCGC